MSDIFIGQDIDAIFNEAKKRGAQGAEDLQAILNELRPDAETERTLEIKRQIQESRNSTYAKDIEEHKRLTRGGFQTGYRLIDEAGLFFLPGQLNTIQGLSGHGKTTFMMNLLYRFVSGKTPRQDDAKPVKAVLISYEATEQVKEKLTHVISRHEGDRIVWSRNGYKYEYDTTTDHAKKVESIYNDLLNTGKVTLLKWIGYHELDEIIKLLNEKDKTLVVFVDYFQAIPTPNINADGWERIKEMARGLTDIAERNKVIIFTGSQSNESGEVREGKDIENYSHNVIKVINHSKPKLQSTAQKLIEYKPKKDGRYSYITVSIDKGRTADERYLKHYLLWDGFVYAENPDYDENTQGIQEQPAAKPGKHISKKQQEHQNIISGLD